MVMIFAWGRISSCRFKFLSEGNFSRSSESRFPIRSRIWEAAALVKVTTRSRSRSTGFSGSVIMDMIRSTRTAVFPLPAAAATKRFLSLKEMIFFCSAVHSTAI